MPERRVGGKRQMEGRRARGIWSEEQLVGDDHWVGAGRGGTVPSPEGKDRRGDSLGLSLNKPWMAPVIELAQGHNSKLICKEHSYVKCLQCEKWSILMAFTHEETTQLYLPLWFLQVLLITVLTIFSCSLNRTMHTLPTGFLPGVTMPKEQSFPRH